MIVVTVTNRFIGNVILLNYLIQQLSHENILI